MRRTLAPTLENYLSANDKLGFGTNISNRGTVSGCRHLTLCQGIISYTLYPCGLSVKL